jgi:lipopolysaccharide export system protein LptC
MSLARTDSLDERNAILDRLASRNRIVSVLRIVVPAAGAAALLVLVTQIYVANMMRQYGISGIRIDRGALVVDAPQYSAVGKDGSRYNATARDAHAAIGDPKMITMDDVSLELARPVGNTLHLRAETAVADTARNVVTVPGTATLRDDKGMHGTLSRLRADLDAGTAVGEGPVDLTFAGGAHLTAAGMHYDGPAQLWSFERVTLVLPDLPEASP